MNQAQMRAENRIWALVAYVLVPLGSLLALLLVQDDRGLGATPSRRCWPASWAQ